MHNYITSMFCIQTTPITSNPLLYTYPPARQKHSSSRGLPTPIILLDTCTAPITTYPSLHKSPCKILQYTTILHASNNTQSNHHYVHLHYTDHLALPHQLTILLLTLPCTYRHACTCIYICKHKHQLHSAIHCDPAYKHQCLFQSSLITPALH